MSYKKVSSIKKRIKRNLNSVKEPEGPHFTYYSSVEQYKAVTCGADQFSVAVMRE